MSWKFLFRSGLKRLSWRLSHKIALSSSGRKVEGHFVIGADQGSHFPLWEYYSLIHRLSLFSVLLENLEKLFWEELWRGKLAREFPQQFTDSSPFPRSPYLFIFLVFIFNIYQINIVDLWQSQRFGTRKLRSRTSTISTAINPPSSPPSSIP